jgi:hypothetical protein
MSKPKKTRGQNPWLARLFGYACAGMALALSLAPMLHVDRKKEFITRPRVYLSAQALTPEPIQAVCGKKPLRLKGTAMADYPALMTAISQLSDSKRPLHKAIISQQKLNPLFLKGQKPGGGKMCIMWREAVYLLHLRHAGSPFKSSLVRVGASPAQSGPVRRLRADEIAAYPFLHEYVARLNQTRRNLLQKPQTTEPAQPPSWQAGGDPAEQMHKLRKHMEAKYKALLNRLDPELSPAFYRQVQSPSGVEAWQPLLLKLGGQAGLSRFKTGDFLVNIQIRDHSQWVLNKQPDLLTYRLGFGAALLLLGVFFMRGAYGPKPGIRINSPWAALFADGVFVAGMAALSSGLTDFVFMTWLGLEPMLDDALRYVFSLMYLPCLLFLSFFAANLGGQSLETGPQGITWHGPVSSRRIGWAMIQGIELKNSYVLVGRLGILMPRRLQTKLVFKLLKPPDVELFEPGTRRRKGAILDALARHLPKRLRADIEKARASW